MTKTYIYTNCIIKSISFKTKTISNKNKKVTRFKNEHKILKLSSELFNKIMANYEKN